MCIAFYATLETVDENGLAKEDNGKIDEFDKGEISIVSLDEKNKLTKKKKNKKRKKKKNENENDQKPLQDDCNVVPSVRGSLIEV